MVITIKPGLKLLSPQYLGRVLEINKEMNIKPKDVLFDLGCGSGDHLLGLNLPQNLTYVGIDCSKSEVTKAKKLKNVFDKFHVIVADAQYIPLKDKSADALISSDVLEHVDDDKKACFEMWRVMKNHSRAYLTVACAKYPFFYDPINYILTRLGKTPLKFGIWGWGHKRLYEKDALDKLLKNSNFKDIKISFINHDLVALIENYTGYIFMNYIFKGNGSNSERFGFLEHFKPFTKTICALDYLLFKKRENGTSLFVVLEK
jgi:SAM-dependent methyltransferase